jgi:hypothetical protein
MLEQKNTPLYGPIETLEEAEAVISDAIKGFYALATINLAAMAYLFLFHGTVAGNILEPILLALNGWLLSHNKSRTLALLIFLYSLGILAITIAAKVGAQLPGGMNGTYVILAVIFVYIAYKCALGTFVYHKRQGTEVNWKETVLRSALSPIYAVVALIITIFGFGLTVAGSAWAPALEGPTTALIDLAMVVPALIVFYATALGKIPPTGSASLFKSEFSEHEPK